MLTGDLTASYLKVCALAEFDSLGPAIPDPVVLRPAPWDAVDIFAETLDSLAPAKVVIPPAHRTRSDHLGDVRVGDFRYNRFGHNFNPLFVVMRAGRVTLASIARPNLY
jgi:hypothetical protein